MQFRSDSPVSWDVYLCWMITCPFILCFSYRKWFGLVITWKAAYALLSGSQTKKMRFCSDSPVSWDVYLCRKVTCPFFLCFSYRNLHVDLKHSDTSARLGVGYGNSPPKMCWCIGTGIAWRMGPPSFLFVTLRRDC